MIGSLFAGIGGFDLAARWMGWETAWFSEIDPYASAVLEKHWPGVPNHGDITKIDFGAVEPVDMLCGGFPCQDLSLAGRMAGLAGERSGLWSEYARAIRGVRPRWVVIENVPPLLSGGFDVVRGDLRTAGYRVARPVLMPAAEVGAPHIRDRLWVVAHAEVQPERAGLRPDEPERQWGRRSGDSGSPLADAHGERLEIGQQGAAREQPAALRGDWWESEPDVGRVAHGIPRRVDRIRALGNAIVPQCALVIFQAIEGREAAMNAERIA